MFAELVSRFTVVLDILLVALVIYGLFYLIQGTRAVQLLRGIFFVVFLAVLASSIFQLTAFSWLIRNSIPALLVAIPVVFQPELRRALERLGRPGMFLSRRNVSASQVAPNRWIFRERQHTGRRDDPIIAHDHRAVVQRGVLEKNRV